MTTPTSKNAELVRQVRENARARYGDLDSEYVRMLKAKEPEAQDLWIIALNLADALEAAGKQAHADEEAMREAKKAIRAHGPCEAARLLLIARLKAREGEGKEDG